MIIASSTTAKSALTPAKTREQPHASKLARPVLIPAVPDLGLRDVGGLVVVVSHDC